MEKIERIKLAIERGYTYNSETGIIYNRLGKEVNSLCLGYIQICISLNNKTYQLRGHQFAWYYTYGKLANIIDHINGIKNDNRICNLREVTKQENGFNTNAKGYTFLKSINKYKGQIRLNNKLIYLGLFDTEEEAQQAYLIAKEKYHIIEKRD